MKPEQETRERILRAAFELFSSRGYDPVSINQIVERAGVSKGGLFHHFDSKYVLARDCLMWWSYENLSPALHMDDPGFEPEEALTEFIDFMMKFLYGDVHFTRFFWSVFDESIRRQEDTNVWIDFFDQYVTLVEGIYARMGVKDPRMKALLLLSNLDGLTLYHSLITESGLEFDMRDLRDELIRTYVKFDGGEE